MHSIDIFRFLCLVMSEKPRSVTSNEYPIVRNGKNVFMELLCSYSICSFLNTDCFISSTKVVLFDRGNNNSFSLYQNIDCPKEANIFLP